MYGLPCDTVRRGKFRTRTVPNGLNPLFNEEITRGIRALPETFKGMDTYFLRRLIQFDQVFLYVR
jgi:hypothetical protein